MRRLRTLLIVPALLALMAGGAAQGETAQRGLDPSFGSGGTATVTVPIGDERPYAFVVSPDGRGYILEGSLLLAFRSDGTVDTEFGENGQVTIAPAFAVGEAEGEAEPSDLALDSQGRLLVTGSAPLPGQKFPAPPNQKFEEAYVIRFLPNGSRDPEFGTGGEVDTDFGLKTDAGQAASVNAAAITVDAHDLPVIGGAFGEKGECGLGFNEGPAPFVTRLTATGALDSAFARTGHVTLTGYGGVTGLTPIPGGGFAVFSRGCATPPRLDA